MSTGLKKRLEQYRLGDDWRSNFKHINYPNIEASLRSILTAEEPRVRYDRLGNRVGIYTATPQPISLDEKIFRIAVLFETEVRSIIQQPQPSSAAGTDALTDKHIREK